jgi:hypothetical protein
MNRATDITCNARHVRVDANGLSDSSIRELTEATRSGFGSRITYEDAKSHIQSGGFLHVFVDGIAHVGFASYDLLMRDKGGDGLESRTEERLLYVRGTVVREEYQCSGLFSRSLESIIDETRPDYLVLRTQSPIPYHVLSRRGSTYPSFETPTEKAVGIAAWMASKLGMIGYVPNEFVERGTYGKSLYGKQVESKDQYANRLFCEKLKIDIRRGDSVMVVTALAGHGQPTCDGSVVGFLRPG